MLEAIVAYGAPLVAGNYIAPVTRYVGKTVGRMMDAAQGVPWPHGGKPMHF